MRASRWGGRFGCLEATYEESKRVAPGRAPLAEGLEATYEESKLQGQLYADRVADGLEATYEESKLLPPAVVVTLAGLEATYEESKQSLGKLPLFP